MLAIHQIKEATIIYKIKTQIFMASSNHSSLIHFGSLLTKCNITPHRIHTIKETTTTIHHQIIEPKASAHSSKVSHEFIKSQVATNASIIADIGRRKNNIFVTFKT